MTDTPNVQGTPQSQSMVATFVIGAVLALFVVLIGLLVVSALTRRSAAEFAPTPIERRDPATSLVIDTITIDARDPDEWQWFSFATQSVVQAPETWDLGFRRFNVIAARGAQDLGTLPFAEISEAPSTGYITTDFGFDTTSAFEDWYRYNFLSHLLEPRGNTYAIETQDGGHAKISLLSYYCPELEAGCITFAYAFQPDGSRRFNP